MEKSTEQLIQDGRQFMKSNFTGNQQQSDQQKQLTQPPLTKAAVSDAIIPLTKNFESAISERDYVAILQDRVSNRFYADKAMSIEQLSFLLWSTQAVREIRGNNYAALRYVPSGGARHAFETYLAVCDVEGLEEGIYHYLPMEHALELVEKKSGLRDTITDIACRQKWASKAAVTFIYTAVPYRAEWRYSASAHKILLIDVGHVVQNLYLSCGAVECGTCAIGAFLQKETDELIHVDGENEYTIYMAPVGVRDRTKNTAGNNQLYAKY